MSQELLVKNVGYSENCKTGVVIPALSNSVQLFSARVLNQSGSAIDAAICKKLANSSFQVGQIIVANTPDFVDVTSSLQAGTATTIFDATTNDGFLVGAEQPFNIIGLNISQAGGGSPVYALQYFNGTSYVTMTAQTVPTSYATGTQLLVFPSPQDWAKGTTAAVGGNQNIYNMQIIATTAGTGAVQANGIWVCKFLEFQSALANNASLEFKMLDSVRPVNLHGGEQLLPYFGGTANAKNMFRVVYSILG